MKGTEKIIAHIRADGDAEAKKIIDAASKQAEEKRAESFKAALSEYEKLMQAGNAECEDILSGPPHCGDGGKKERPFRKAGDDICRV